METPKRRETDQNCIPPQRSKTRNNHEQIRIMLQECMTYRTREKLYEPMEKSQTFLDCMQRFLDCEFRNPIAVVLKGLMRKFVTTIKDKGRDSKCHQKNNK